MFCRRISSFILLVIVVLSCQKVKKIEHRASLKADLVPDSFHQCQESFLPSDSIDFIYDSKYAATVMKQLTHVLLWWKSSPEQLDMLFDKMEYLAPKCTDSEDMIPPIIHGLLFKMRSLSSAHCFRMLNIMPTLINHIKTSENASLLTQSFTGAINSNENLNSNHVSEILAIITTLITHVETSEDIASVIYDLKEVIMEGFLGAYKYKEVNGWLLTPDQLHDVLLMLKPLIEKVEESEARTVKKYLNKIKEGFSNPKHVKDRNSALFDEILRAFDERFPM